MISTLMLYGTKVALIVGLVGLVLERVAVWCRFPRRLIWASTLALSLAVPTIELLIGQQPIEPYASMTHSSPSSGSPQRIRSQQLDSNEIAPSSAILPIFEHVTLARPTRTLQEHVLAWLWILTSGVLASLYAFLWLRLQMATRSWQIDRIGDQQVWVTEQLGPAVWGILKPMILMPRWILDAPQETQALVLVHEQEHIAARDPALLLLGRILLIIAPWNLPLWWQMQQLRFSVEVDCDARVLRHGAPVRAYGEVLLAVGERRSLIPVGVTALTEPASQLLRRIRIMTSAIPTRGKWAVAGALCLSLTGLAIAADMQVPVLRAGGVESALLALRKLPFGEDPRLSQVQNVVRSTYPELFDATAKPGPVLVTLLMNPDGTLYKTRKEAIEPRPWIANSLQAFDAMGVDYEHRGDGVQLRMQHSPNERTYVDVRAWYLKPPADPSRDVATVRAKVRARYAALFKPEYADGSHDVTPDGSSVLTVFMTEGGDIDRATVEDKNGEQDALSRPERFVAMGVARERIGLMGTTEITTGHFTDDRDAKTLRVIYAWPRRPQERESAQETPDQPLPTGGNDEPAVDRAIAEEYFPDLYSHPTEWPRADPWVLLDRRGEVLTTGRRVVMSGGDIKLYVESLYPGIRTKELQIATVQGDQGQRADIGFVWLSPDSPVTDLSKVDFSMRNAVLVYADVIGEGMTRPTVLAALKAGSPSVIVCSLKNPFGMVRVQITALDIARDTVTARLRIQQTPLPSDSEIPNALDTAWSSESTVVRALYNASTDVQLADQNGKVWKIVLHPDRLTATGGGNASVKGVLPQSRSKEPDQVAHKPNSGQTLANTTRANPTRVSTN